jgi:hypothetical protein
MTRETSEGMHLAYWSTETDPSLFSIGAEAGDARTVLIRDVTLPKGVTNRKMDIRFQQPGRQSKQVHGRTLHFLVFL